jgi:hypothetical protein
LKLAYELRNQNPDSQTPNQFFNGTKARDTLDYYSSAVNSGVTAGGTDSTPWTTGHDNNFLNDVIGSPLFTNSSQFANAVNGLTHTESLQGYSAASPPRQISVNRISLVSSVSNNNGTVSASDNFPSPVNLHLVDTDTLDSGSHPPRTIDRLGSGFAHTPGEPLSSGSFTYAKTNYAAQSAPSASATSCLIIERRAGTVFFSWNQVPSAGHDIGFLPGWINTSWPYNYVTEAFAGRYRVSAAGRSDISGHNCVAEVTNTTDYQIQSLGAHASPFQFEVKRKWTSEYLGDPNSKGTNLTIRCGTNPAKDNIVTQTFQAPDGLLRSKAIGSFVFKYYPSFQFNININPNCVVTGSPTSVRLYYDPTGVANGPNPYSSDQIYPLIWDPYTGGNCRTPDLYTSNNLNPSSKWNPSTPARHFQYSSGCNSGSGLGFQYDPSQGRFLRVCPP